MTTMTPIPPSVKRFERVLFSGLMEAGLDPDDFKPRCISPEDIAKQLREAGIPEDKLTGPAMAISQLAWSDEDSDRDIAIGFMSTVVIFQEAVAWYADYKDLSNQFFGVLYEFDNVQTPEIFAARLLVHMITADPMYPPGMTVAVDDDGNFSVQHLEKDE